MLEHSGEKNIELKSNITVRSVPAVAAVPQVVLLFLLHITYRRNIKTDCSRFWMFSCAVLQIMNCIFFMLSIKSLIRFSCAIALVLTLQKFYYYQWGKVLIYRKVKAGKLLSSIWAWELLLKRNFIHKNVSTGLSKEYNV